MLQKPKLRPLRLPVRGLGPGESRFIPNVSVMRAETAARKHRPMKFKIEQTTSAGQKGVKIWRIE